MLDLNKLQIETTTRCTLKCPACSRTWWKETLGKKIPIYDIDPTLVYNFLNCDTGKKIKKLDLRGDWGDSIYYPNLFNFIDLVDFLDFLFNFIGLQDFLDFII